MSLEGSAITVVGTMDRNLVWRYRWPEGYDPPSNLVWKTFVVKLASPIDERTLQILANIGSVVENLNETLVLVQARRVKKPIALMQGSVPAVHNTSEFTAPPKGTGWYHANLELGEFRAITRFADQIVYALPGCEVYLVRNMLPSFDVIYVPGPHPALKDLEEVEEKEKKSKKRKRTKK